MDETAILLTAVGSEIIIQDEKTAAHYVVVGRKSMPL